MCRWERTNDGHDEELEEERRGIAWMREGWAVKSWVVWKGTLPLLRYLPRRCTRHCERRGEIMARLGGNLISAQVLYPIMQCADVFFLKADCQLCVDQREVNMLAREYCDAIKRKFKPVILSHHMLYGLKKGQEKMSKSDPDSAIFMEDTEGDVERKIRSAYCPTLEEMEEEQREAMGDDGEIEIDAGKESMHLKEDELKNPILDYIQNIIRSRPNASYTCQKGSASSTSTTYTEFEQVKNDYLNGSITPDQLKGGLIVELNKLLQPVRDHFENNERAKGLLEQVRNFKKESLTTSQPEEKCLHLDLIKQGLVPSQSHLVFSPLPSSNPTLGEAVNVYCQLQAGQSAGGDGGDHAGPIVLLLTDWTAKVNNALEGEDKLISSYYSILLVALRALDAHFGNHLMERVTIVTQSKAILTDPSNYWVSVINAGRFFSLDTVMGIDGQMRHTDGYLGEGMKDSECVGKVIGRLMMVADVLGVNPRTIALDSVPVVASTGAEGDVADQVSNMSLNSSIKSMSPSTEAILIQKNHRSKLSSPHLFKLLLEPQIMSTFESLHPNTTENESPASTSVNSSKPVNPPNLSLQPPRESAAHKTEFDEYFLLDDPKVHGKSKMKKAYCEPSNVEFCPPIELLAHFGGLPEDGGGAGDVDGAASASSASAVTISRSPENGGDIHYSSKSHLQADFTSGSLHPGDLKNAVSSLMVKVLTNMSEAIKGDKEAATGAKGLKAWEKKMSKMKKK